MATLSFFLSFSTLADTKKNESLQAQNNLANLEKTFDGKLGIYAINMNNNEVIAYRASERFPVQSTLKLIGVAALLKESEKNKNLLHEKIHYTKNDLMAWPWHPVTGQHLADGMTLEALGEAAVTYSDNPAMNLIMKKFGGPKFVTDFAYSIGNKTFNIEHYEGELNSNPHDSHDTSTPMDMALSLQKITLGHVLTPSLRTKLVTWMRNNTVGYKRIRAGVPIGWVVADKTGSGDYGVANDIGIVWSPTCKPVVLAIYTVQNQKDAKRREDIIAAATTIVFDEFSKTSSCFNQ